MKRISRSKAQSRKMMLRGVLRWIIYAVALLLFYVWETNPLIRGWCPLLIIPLATAVAMHEGDLAAGIFGAVCGLMLDMASGVNVVGFSALWLLALCPFISLLSRFWIKMNWFSHFIMNLAVTVIMAFMDLLFLHLVWEGSQMAISFRESIFPAYFGAILFSVPVYLLVDRVVRSLRPKEERRLEESAFSAEESEDKNRE